MGELACDGNLERSCCFEASSSGLADLHQPAGGGCRGVADVDESYKGDAAPPSGVDGAGGDPPAADPEEGFAADTPAAASYGPCTELHSRLPLVKVQQDDATCYLQQYTYTTTTLVKPVSKPFL